MPDTYPILAIMTTIEEQMQTNLPKYARLCRKVREEYGNDWNREVTFQDMEKVMKEERIHFQNEHMDFVIYSDEDDTYDSDATEQVLENINAIEEEEQIQEDEDIHEIINVQDDTIVISDSETENQDDATSSYATTIDSRIRNYCNRNYPYCYSSYSDESE